MKTNIKIRSFLFAVLFAPSICLHSQSNFPFPSVYAEWHWMTVLPLIGSNDQFTQIRNFIQGDTLFKGKHYTKAFRQSLCQCTCNGPNGDFQPTVNQEVYLIGGVREEAGKVYFTTFGQAPFDKYYRPVNDTLLYDFTLEAGDTLLYGGFKLAVTMVDSTLEGRKIIHLKTYIGNSSKTFSWTEGIGFLGLLETLNYITDYWYYAGFGCFSDVLPSDCSLLCLISSASTTPEKGQDIRIFPSFASETVKVELGSDFQGIRLQIFTVEGKLLKCIQTEENTLELNVSDMPSGLYHFVFEKSPGRLLAKTYVR